MPNGRVTNVTRRYIDFESSGNNYSAELKDVRDLDLSQGDVVNFTHASGQSVEGYPRAINVSLVRKTAHLGIQPIVTEPERKYESPLDAAKKAEGLRMDDIIDNVILGDDRYVEVGKQTVFVDRCNYTLNGKTTEFNPDAMTTAVRITNSYPSTEKVERRKGKGVRGSLKIKGNRGTDFLADFKALTFDL